MCIKENDFWEQNVPIFFSVHISRKMNPHGMIQKYSENPFETIQRLSFFLVTICYGRDYWIFNS